MFACRIIFIFLRFPFLFFFFFFNDTATTEIYTLSLHDALPIFSRRHRRPKPTYRFIYFPRPYGSRSEEHTSELQSRPHLVCRLLLEKKKKHQQQRCFTETIENCLDQAPAPGTHYYITCRYAFIA